MTDKPTARSNLSKASEVSVGEFCLTHYVIRSVDGGALHIIYYIWHNSSAVATVGLKNLHSNKPTFEFIVEGKISVVNENTEESSEAIKPKIAQILIDFFSKREQLNVGRVILKDRVNYVVNGEGVI